MRRVPDDDRCFEWLDEFDCSEREQVENWNELSKEERARICRLEAEVWGLMPCAVDPVAPTSECKQRILRELDGGRLDFVPPARTAPRQPRWLLPLAAGLALLAVGFALSMLSTVRQQRRQLAALQAEVEQLSASQADAPELAEGVARLRENLGLVSSRGVGICALRPTEAVGESEDAPYGVLFVAADHQHWYVRVHGLEPEPGSYYRLWFETDSGLVPAGNLSGSELELSSPTMPAGTRAVHVSRETEPSPSVPSDQILLFGDDMVEVL